jgi:hypothetical protein
MRKTTVTLTGLLIGLCLGSPILAQKIKTVDGVTVVSNGKKPVAVKGQPSRIALVEELAFGGGGNPDESLSQVNTFVVDGEGGVFALDFKEQKIKAFDKAGKFLRQMGKPGQGPGELGMASGIQRMSDGNLIVEDAANRRLALFKPSGEFIKNISMSDKLGLINILMDNQGNFIGREMGIAQDSSKMFFEIKKFDSNLKPLFTLDKIEFPVPIPGSGTKLNVLEMISAYQFGPGGNIYYGRNADYEVRVYSPEGKPVRTIQKEYDRIKVTQADIDEILERIPNVAGGVNIKEMFDFPEVFPPFQSFLLDDDGRLYVRTFTKGKVKGEYVFDVFDPDGVFFAQLISKSDLRLFKAGKAYGIEETDEGYQVIKRYSVSTE